MPGIDPLGPPGTNHLDAAFVREEVRRFLAEDIGAGDVTTRSTIPPDAATEAVVVARQPCVVAGLDVAFVVFTELDADVRCVSLVGDGAHASAGAPVATVAGPARAILTGERVALNLLQRLSGIATLTRRYVDEVAGTGASISDTRKTTPGLRLLEKYAVRAGGGRNHRIGLFDAVLIKDNHLVAAGGVTAALEAVRGSRRQLPVQVEVDSLGQLDEALAAGVDGVLLDNMQPAMVARAVQLIRAHARGATCWIEASGGITLANVRQYAETGVDTISVGALTHSAPAVDLALDFKAV